VGVLFDVGDSIYELVLIFGWMMGGSGEKGKFRESSAIRHRIVMERIFSADVSLETAREAAIAVNNRGSKQSVQSTRITCAKRASQSST